MMSGGKIAADAPTAPVNLKKSGRVARNGANGSQLFSLDPIAEGGSRIILPFAIAMNSRSADRSLSASARFVKFISD
ncbi:hypothetical protein ACFPL7_02080 [Dongia soli]|uniref:hypothetical protein n=1 Tax=Dongia soli TaxID=600628 RepID=UPI002A6A0BD1|nr:hypothetical protein [Dongia soli]